jgi:hypothetical protein
MAAPADAFLLLPLSTVLDLPTVPDRIYQLCAFCE